jgi:hypothetical protein
LEAYNKAKQEEEYVHPQAVSNSYTSSFSGEQEVNFLACNGNADCAKDFFHTL